MEASSSSLPLSILVTMASSSARAVSNFMSAMGVGSMSEGSEETRENTLSGGFWSNAGRGKILPFQPAGGVANVRRGESVQVGPRSFPTAGGLVFRREDFRAGEEAHLRCRSGLCWPPADGAGGGRLSFLGVEGSRPDAAQRRRRGQECRYLADVQRLSSPPGDHAAGFRQAERAGGLPDSPLDLRPGRRVDRCTAFPAEPLPEPEPEPAGKLERPALQRRSEEHTSELQSHHDLVCRL